MPTTLGFDLVGGTSSTPWPWAIPVATLIAAVGSVYIGGRMNRHTMRTLEKEREEREDARDRARWERDVEADRRVAVASRRLIIGEVESAKIDRNLEAKSEPRFRTFLRCPRHPVRIRPEDKHAAAVWVSPESWHDLAAMLLAVEIFSSYREIARQQVERDDFDAEAYRKTAAIHVQMIDKSIELLGPELAG